jgi:hypothetical protein
VISIPKPLATCLDTKPNETTALAFASALGYFELQIDGKPVETGGVGGEVLAGAGGASQFEVAVPFTTYDIADLLHTQMKARTENPSSRSASRNTSVVLSVRIGGGYWTHFGYGNASFRMQVVIAGCGARFEMGTDDQWLAADSGLVKEDIVAGEWFDSRLDPSSEWRTDVAFGPRIQPTEQRIQPTEKPTEQPTEQRIQPTEQRIQPTEKPTEQRSEQPADQPAHGPLGTWRAATVLHPDVGEMVPRRVPLTRRIQSYRTPSRVLTSQDLGGEGGGASGDVQSGAVRGSPPFRSERCQERCQERYQ